MDADNIRYFFPKIANRIAVEKNRFWKYCAVDRIAMMGYKPFFDSIELKTRLHLILGEFSADMLDGVSVKDFETIIQSADQTMRHEFELLGSGVVKNDPIDWHVDLKSGKHWVKKFYREIGSLPGADIKMPWELSRCQHLLWLGEACLLTKDNKYAKEIVDEISWWIDENPLMYTVNWTCAMDVAFRAINWLFALNMIVGYEGFNDTFAEKVQRSLWQHGFYIRNNLEKVIPDSNNHYTSDLVGLLYIGALFKKTHVGNSWFRLAIKELKKETLNQVLPSGVHYERSVSYHRMMTEMLSYPIYMLNRMKIEVSDGVMGRLQSMYNYIANYTKPNGLSPLIADNDDGRFLPFLERDFREHNYLNNPNSVENRMVSVGVGLLFHPISCRDGSTLYDDAGAAVIHDGNDYLFINNGGYSKRPKEKQTIIGTHTHNDLLSFELTLNGEDIVVDAGTYLYTSSEQERNAFRSTLKHNTIIVDGEEQNGFVSSFHLKKNVNRGTLQKLKDCTIRGDYTTIVGKMHHERLFDLDKGQCIITDKLSKEGKGHFAKFYLHLAEGLLPWTDGKDVLIKDEAKIIFNTKPQNIEIVEDTLSPSFGVIVHAKTIVATYSFENNIQIITTIKTING